MYLAHDDNVGLGLFIFAEERQKDPLLQGHRHVGLLARPKSQTSAYVMWTEQKLSKH